MKTITKTINLYTFDELNEDAKQAVREWYIYDPYRAELFKENVACDLENLFPASNLDVAFSLSYCQGDGLNVFGNLDFSDMFTAAKLAPRVSTALDGFTEKERRRICYYSRSFSYVLERNRRYCYSCKFVDLKNAEYTAEEWIDALKDQYIRDIDESLILRFLKASFSWLEEYDAQQERAGYTFLYEPDDAEISEACEANDWYFLESGKFYAE